ncbi:MAG: tetratricopeptide repeat protein [Deltaproteobacteria bacterium]|nr:tetratricopeptide repeat protein [Deltaproteobacteria bacterium]
MMLSLNLKNIFEELSDHIAAPGSALLRVVRLHPHVSWLFVPLLVIATLIVMKPVAVLAANTEQSLRNEFLAGKQALEEGNVAKAEQFWKPILGDSLYGPVSYLLLAKGFAHYKSFAKSEALVRDFLKLYPSSPYRDASIEDLTEYVYQQGKPEAHKLLSQSLTDASESRKQTILLRLGDLEAHSKAFDKAFTYYRKLYLNYPATPDGLQAKDRISRLVFNGKIPKPDFTQSELMERASRLAAAGRFDLAANVYRGLLKQKPGDDQLLLKLGRCLYKDRKNDEAIKLLSAILAKPVSNQIRIEAIYLMSLVYWRIDKDSEFEACCSRILDCGSTVMKTKMLINLAAFNYEKGRLSRAESYYKKLLSTASDPSLKAKVKWRIAFDKAFTYYRKLYLNYPATPDGLQAKDRISRLVFNGKIPKPDFTQSELMERASRLAAAGRFDLAANVYRGLLKQKPGDDQLLLKLGRCLYKDRKNDEAIKLLSAILAKPVSNQIRIEAIYLMSLVYWRIDKDSEFEACCSRILDCGSTVMKTKMLINLAAFNYEKGRLSRAESYYKKLLSTASDPSLKAKVKWRIAWIKYRSRKYDEAAVTFREVREVSRDVQLSKASRYWEARALTLAGKFEKALPLFKGLAENSNYDYYGSNSQKILIAAKQPVESHAVSTKRPFPDLHITPALRSNVLVLNALKLMQVDLPEFALLNLEALPKNLRSQYPLVFLMAEAAQKAGYYGLAHNIVVSGFSGFVDNPPADATKEFVELAYPRAHLADTRAHAGRSGVDPFLVWAVVRQESRYDAYAVSPAGALGLMQVTPKTALVINNTGGNPGTAVIQELLDPKKNLAVGIQILARNLREFKGNVVPAVAAYNADIKKVRQWFNRNGRMKQDEFIENIPYSETRLYVKKVLTNLEAYSKIYARKDLARYW